MGFFKAAGLALVSAFITCLGLVGGLIFAVISAIVSILITIGGIFALVYCTIASSQELDRQDQEKNKR